MGAPIALIRTRTSNALKVTGSRGKDKFLNLMFGDDLKRAKEEAPCHQGYKFAFYNCCGVVAHFVKMDRAATPEPVCPFSGSKNLTY